MVWAVNGAGEGAQPTREFTVHRSEPIFASIRKIGKIDQAMLFIFKYFSYKTALDKITEGTKLLINMAGSQNNKLSKINLSLKSFGGALQNLQGDAYNL